MSLEPGERQALAEIESGLRRSDPVSWPNAARYLARCSPPRACSARSTPRMSTPGRPATSTSARMPGRKGCGG